MSLWTKLQTELDRAGRQAAAALDEGKLRLDLFRVRQQADKAAQALGYAYYRARQAGQSLDEATWQRLATTVTEREAEAARLEEQLRAAKAKARGGEGAAPDAPDAPPAPDTPDSPATPPPAEPPPGASAG